MKITLTKNADGSVTGQMPDGRVVKWARDLSNKPTRRNRYVIVNCCRYPAQWVTA